MTSSRRARRRRRQARQARLARRAPALDWLAVTRYYAEAIRQMALSFSSITQCFSHITAKYGKGTVAAMPSWGGYDDRFAEHDDASLALGSVTGIRYWSVGTGPFHDDTGQPVVQLKGARALWRPGENAAVCNGPERHPAGQIPVRRCGCGFWAYWAEDPHRGGSYVTSPDVAGMVQGWGRYRAGTRGFRCAKAKLLAVCVQNHVMGEYWRVACEHALTAMYQVPVYSSVATMMKAFPPSRSPVPEPDPLSGGGFQLYTHRGGGSAFATGGNVTAAGGGSVSASGYSRGGWLPPPQTYVVACLCGVNYGLNPGTGIQCRCGTGWFWDGLTVPAMIKGPSPAEALKKLEQKKDTG